MRIVDRLFSVGRLEPQKNFTSLINILSRSDFGLDIVGKGSLEKELINTANKNGVELNLFNSLEHTELLAFYTKYKYFVLNSDYEGNPKVVLEALASGCVVICKDNINVREVIINNELISEPYVSYNCTLSLFNNCGEFENIKVPKDHFLVLGDNRSNSWDGRYWPGSKFLHKKEIIGKAYLRFWPLNKVGFFNK